MIRWEPPAVCGPYYMGGKGQLRQGRRTEWAELSISHGYRVVYRNADVGVTSTTSAALVVLQHKRKQEQIENTSCLVATLSCQRSEAFYNVLVNIEESITDPKWIMVKFSLSSM